MQPAAAAQFSTVQSSDFSSSEQSPAFDINVFYSIRDDLLSESEQGQHYIDLYETYTPEITEVLIAQPEVLAEAVDVLQLWEPNLNALVVGNGSNATITSEQVQAIQTFLDHLSIEGSPELQQIIASEQTRAPLDQFVGQTMSQAWEEINAFATATPTNTSTNTPTATSSRTPTPTATQTGGTVTFTPIADAYVNADSPTTNYGSSTALRADASPVVRSYLRFNAQGLGGAVTRATLRVFANSASSQGYQVMPVSDNTWVENTINYSNMPSPGSSLGSSGTFGATAWTNVDITPYITGNGVFNLALTTTSNTAISLASRESGANAPQLIVETQGGGGPTLTPTFTPTVTSTATATQRPLRRHRHRHTLQRPPLRLRLPQQGRCRQP